MLYLANKCILLGVTGSIAAYKSADIVRRLREAGAIVRVVMTEHAKRFITPLTLQAVSGHPVHDDLFDLQAEAAMGHIELARWADAIIAAPASGDFMARLARGEANDLLTTVCLATPAPIAVAPAMNQGMWKQAAEHLPVLRQKNIHIFGPAQGSQACGDFGPGRMLEPMEIVEQLSTLFATGRLAGINILVTAGPTHEAIDPVRYITNISSGKMGMAISEAAREAGANVMLISGPTTISKPAHIPLIPVVSGEDMFKAVMARVDDYDIFISVAAVSDYRAQTIASQKIPKANDSWQLTLTRNPDIVASVAKRECPPFIVGFAAQTHDVIASAQKKRQQKNLHMIIANEVGRGKGMGTEDNAVSVITETEVKSLPIMSKDKLARQLIPMIADEYFQFKQKG